jgi:hypothetical protein
MGVNLFVRRDGGTEKPGGEIMPSPTTAGLEGGPVKREEEDERIEHEFLSDKEAWGGESASGH